MCMCHTCPLCFGKDLLFHRPEGFGGMEQGLPRQKPLLPAAETPSLSPDWPPGVLLKGLDLEAVERRGRGRDSSGSWLRWRARWLWRWQEGLVLWAEVPPYLSCCHSGVLASQHPLLIVFSFFFLKDSLPSLSLNLSATPEPSFPTDGRCLCASGLQREWEQRGRPGSEELPLAGLPGDIQSHHREQGLQMYGVQGLLSEDVP